MIHWVGDYTHTKVVSSTNQRIQKLAGNVIVGTNSHDSGVKFVSCVDDKVAFSATERPPGGFFRGDPSEGQWGGRVEFIHIVKVSSNIINGCKCPVYRSVSTV